MPNIEQLQAVMTGTESNRIEALRRMLAYPVKQQRDPQGSRFWYLRPGTDELEVADTLPIAVGFYPELNEATQQEIVTFLTSKEQPPGIYEHYISRVNPDKPVMYILLPEKERTGRVALILPTEGGLRQRQIQTFAWNEQELLGRLSRLEQGQLPIAIKALNLIPLVEWVFYEAAKTAQELARELAKVTRRMEQAIPHVYDAEDANGYLHELLVSFQRELLPNLNLIPSNEKDYSFADIYAQTIAYGLFTARVFSYVKDERQGQDRETYFNREDAWQQLPETNPFLRRLFQGVSERSPENLGEELITEISELIGILRAAKMDAILSDFRQKMNREDIVIRFYEDFLAAYKPQMRERRGVYYTPEPVVSCMVRSVDELLKDKFNKPLGLADPEVMILDPACGTGTFLLCICQLIYQRFQESPDALTEGLADKSWSVYVKERLLPRIFGFELLMAPYAIAHLKLGLFLEETGYQFDSGRRLGVYLTNTLDNAIRKTETLFEEFIVQEADQAAEVKCEQQIMVVIGNPPYSVNSENTGEWINTLLNEYKKNLKEKKLNLDDDFIKFIRFAQWRIDRTGYGILAFISNNTYLEGITHRRMRQSLMQSFDNIYAINLHGSIIKQEKCPDGSKDENIFDIQQGVSIGLFVKNMSDTRISTVIKYSDIWGLRAQKYQALSELNLLNNKWQILDPKQDYFFWVPKNFKSSEEYSKNYGLKEIFLISSPGVKTERDKVSIHWDKKGIEESVQDFKILDEQTLRQKYSLKEDSRDWKVANAKADVIENAGKPLFYPILYRPFDTRYTWYSGKTRGFIGTPGFRGMRHMLLNNVAIIAKRQAKDNAIYTWFNVTNNLVIDGSFAIDNKGRESIFPLYLYQGKRILSTRTSQCQ